MQSYLQDHNSSSGWIGDQWTHIRFIQSPPRYEIFIANRKLWESLKIMPSHVQSLNLRVKIENSAKMDKGIQSNHR